MVFTQYFGYSARIFSSFSLITTSLNCTSLNVNLFDKTSRLFFSKWIVLITFAHQKKLFTIRKRCKTAHITKAAQKLLV